MIRTIIIAVLAIGTVAPAFADWDYTHWGMTAQQVIAASNGAAHVMPPGRRYRDEAAGFEISVEATSKGPPRTDIGFEFDLPGGGLRCVLVNATGDDADLLRAQLVQRYGKAPNESEFGSLHTWSWSKPDAIEFTLNQSPKAGVVNHCAPGKS